MATKNGIVKKTPITDYANVRKKGLAAITLREDDELIEVKAIMMRRSHEKVFNIILLNSLHPLNSLTASILALKIINCHAFNITPICSGNYHIFIWNHIFHRNIIFVIYANVRKKGLAAITLREDDELIEVKATNDENDIFLVTKFGQCIRFNERDVRSTGRTSMGVIGMNLEDQDEVIGMQLNTQGRALLFVSEKGMGKFLSP